MHANRPDARIQPEGARLLDARSRSIPIVDDGVLVGIVTRRDVLRVVARAAS